MRYPQPIQNLIDELTKLPSVGPKTAERYVFYLLRQSPNELQKMAQVIAELKEKTLICSSCGAVVDQNPCQICSDQNRQAHTLCVVANTRDQLNFEATGQYHGFYLILGGLVNAIEGINPDQLNFKSLEARIKTGKLKEIILALSPTLEGETTGQYIKKLIGNNNIKLTRLARGLSTGADLEYTDEMTLINAFKYRNEI